MGVFILAAIPLPAGRKSVLQLWRSYSMSGTKCLDRAGGCCGEGIRLPHSIVVLITVECVPCSISAHEAMIQEDYLQPVMMPWNKSCHYEDSSLSRLPTKQISNRAQTSQAPKNVVVGAARVDRPGASGSPFCGGEGRYVGLEGPG